MLSEKLFYFDIETAGKYKDFQTFESEDPRGAKLFKSKIKKRRLQNPHDDRWQGTDDEVYKKNATLLPEYGLTVCVSYGFYDNGELKVGTLSGDEKSIIEKSEAMFNKIASVGKIVCGYNVKNFDLPWLFKKMLMYKITPPSNVSTFNKKPWELTAVDFMEIWKSTSWEYSTFDEMAYSLDIPSPKESMDGSMVHDAYHNGQIADIIKYCENDVIALSRASKILCPLL